jgi:sulfur-oxidizing protein SoxY
MTMIERVSRRRFLVAAAGAAGACLLPLPGRPVRATPEAVAEAIRAIVGEAELRQGRVELEMPVLVENGNAVATTVRVEAPLEGPERVQSIHLFAEGNPLPNVASFHFGPRAGEPVVSTRIRLATSQTVIAVAKLADGSCWSDSIELLVTLAACLDE